MCPIPVLMHLIPLHLRRFPHALIGLATIALCLATAPASFATNPFPITESFTHTSLGSGWNMGGSAAGRRCGCSR